MNKIFEPLNYFHLFNTHTLEYVTPNYSESSEILDSYESSDQPQRIEQGKSIQIYPGFIKLIPKLTEEKVIAKTIKELKNRSVGVLPADDINKHFNLQPGFESHNASVEYLILRRNKDPDNKDGIALLFY